MITQQLIEEVIARLVETYKPIAIYIFGSYAWGTPTEDSDLDILVVVDHYNKDRHALLAEGHKALIGLRLSKDILLYSKDEFEAFSSDSMRLCHKVKNEGLKLYEAYS